MVHDDSSTQQIVVGECLLYLLANVEMLMNLRQDLNWRISLDLMQVRRSNSTFGAGNKSITMKEVRCSLSHKYFLEIFINA